MPDYLAELVLKELPILMIGGGRVAERKLHGLLAAEARPRLIAPHLNPTIQEWKTRYQLPYLAETFAPHHLEAPPRPTLVFATTSDRTLNITIATRCRELGILCNSADDPEISGFRVPAVIRRGPVVVGVATGGQSPALARLLKEQLADHLPPGWGTLATLFGELRAEVQRLLPQAEIRQTFWRETALAALREEQHLAPSPREWLLTRLTNALDQTPSPTIASNSNCDTG